MQSKENSRSNTPTTPTPSEANSAVSGVPLLQPLQTPMMSGYQQHQFPPPLLQSYVPYGVPLPPNQDSPPPPSLYYSQYPVPSMAPRVLPDGVVIGQGYTIQPMPPGDGHFVVRNAERIYTPCFDQVAPREAFVLKVLFLSWIQLVLITSVSGVFLTFNAIKKEAVDRNVWIFYLSILLILLIYVLRMMSTENKRKPSTVLCLFSIWSAGLVLMVSWSTALLHFHFLFVTLLLLGTLIFSVLVVSTVSKYSILSFPTSVISVCASVAVSIVVLITYERTFSTVLFGNFFAVIIFLYLFFRLHFLMTDEKRNLQPNEFFFTNIILLF